MIASLYQEIGQLEVELDWLKKSVSSVEEKRALIEPEYDSISVACLSEFVGLARFSY